MEKIKIKISIDELVVARKAVQIALQASTLRFNTAHDALMVQSVLFELGHKLQKNSKSLKLPYFELVALESALYMSNNEDFPLSDWGSLLMKIQPHILRTH
jgi:hypothetical protein